MGPREERKSVLMSMGVDFKLYCLQLQNPVQISQTLVLFLVGKRVYCSIPMEMKFQGILSLAPVLVDFPVG